MTHPELSIGMARARTHECQRVAAQGRLLTFPTRRAKGCETVTIRFADSLDKGALRSLSELDSAEPLRLPVLVAEVEGELRAALSTSDSRVIADPFRPTADLVALLQLRAQQLRRADRGPAPARRLRLRGHISRRLRLAPRT